MKPDVVQQILQDYDTSRRPGTDPELEAVRTAILLEDIFEITLSDAEIDLAGCADTTALIALVARLRGSA